jgi:hypothetical protein
MLRIKSLVPRVLAHEVTLGKVVVGCDGKLIWSITKYATILMEGKKCWC